MRMRKDAKFYVVAIILVALIYLAIKGTSSKHDFRKAAKSKLQLTSEQKAPPSSCDHHELTAEDVKVSIVVSTKANEDAVITQTVNSVLAHTDPSLLLEVLIAVDKMVTKDRLQLLTQEFAEYSPLVTIMHGQTGDRLKNKFVVGHSAKGNVIVFIDDTVVVTENYLNPLLETLKDHPEGIAVPSYDYFTEMTASVEKTWSLMKWVFGWRLDIEAYELSFQEIANRQQDISMPSMVFDSSAFAIYKTYLEKLGSIKHDMRYAGSTDLSFATWLCGGGAYVVPCSRVAKVQSASTSMPGENKMKHMVAERYFTEKYLRLFRQVNPAPVSLTKEENNHLTIEKNFQKKCHRDFDWYMKTIVKEDVFVPSDEAVAYGYFNSKSGHVCFRQTPAMIFLGYYGCKMHSRGKMFEYLKSGQLRSGNDCITNGGKGGSYMVTDTCDYNKSSFKWITNKHRQFRSAANQCISHATDPYKENNERQVLMFTKCAEESNPSSFQWQLWNSFIWLDGV